MSNSDFEATVNNKVAVKTTKKTNKETNVKKTYTHSDGSTFEYTSISELKDIREMLAELQQEAIVTTAVKGPRQATKSEACLSHRLLGFTQKQVNNTLNWVTPKVAGVEIALRDETIPAALDGVAASTGYFGAKLTAISMASTNKAKSFRKELSPEQRAAAFAKKLEKMVASDPQGAVMYQAMQMAKA